MRKLVPASGTPHLFQMMLQLLCLLPPWFKFGAEPYKHPEAFFCFIYFQPFKAISNNGNIIAVPCKTIWPHPLLLPWCCYLHDWYGIDLGNITGLAIILQVCDLKSITYQGISWGLFSTFLFLISKCTYGAAAKNRVRDSFFQSNAQTLLILVVTLPCSLQTPVCHCIVSFHQRSGKHSQGRLLSLPGCVDAEVQYLALLQPPVQQCPVILGGSMLTLSLPGHKFSRWD